MANFWRRLDCAFLPKKHSLLNQSAKLGHNEPYLTLELLEECIQGFRASTIELKHVNYMTVVAGLGPFLQTFDAKRLKVALIPDKLITLTIEEVDMYPSCKYLG